MSIHEVSRERLFKVGKTDQSLRPGQIIQGKILKLYPHDKAEIKLGAQVLVAQLTASLSVGERYHFQVQETTDDAIHLRVLGDELKATTRVNATELIRNLGLKRSRANIDFVQSLINKNFSINREQLIRSFQLLDNVKNKTQAQQVLQEMIIRKYPLSNSVFQALYTKDTNDLSDQLNTLLQELKRVDHPTNLQINLTDRLNQIIKQPMITQYDIVTQIIKEMSTRDRHFFNLLQSSGMVNHSINYPTWSSEWKIFSNQHHLTTLKSDNQQPISTLPFRIHADEIEQLFKRLHNHRSDIRQGMHNLIQKWSTHMNEAIDTKNPMSEVKYTQLKQDINDELPQLTSHQHQYIKALKNTPVQLQQLLTVLHTLENKQTYLKIDHLITFDKSDLLMKNQFLKQVSQVLQFIGLTHENMIMNDHVQREITTTMKSMLIQLMQQSDSGSNDRVQQLLHFINGLQLQSVNETSHFIQASLQLPGEKLSLNNDLYMDFESKKTDDGQVNSDYCRVLFYLDLVNLQETIVDMQIQKRLVSVTIFNDQFKAQEKSMILQSILKENLQKLDYDLTTITMKPLHQMKGSMESQSFKEDQKSYERIDYRV